MEILIVGAVLVALMVFVSTKIKRSAARAFEREIIETGDFRIVKPEGFINPVNENSEYAFEAHSKDFGENEAHDVRQASASLSVSPASNFDAACKAAKQSFDKISSEKFVNEDAQNKAVCLLEGEKTENGTSFSVFRKIVESKDGQNIYDLKISALKANYEQYSDRIDEMLDSFGLK